ncbi:hypothetical protein FNH22_03540 [Fulvivirga sp. M361]|uniref:hypothetical protein n=1 Tax=Fulvivirga sp. M361 TaxID=2594266 RepID=UPI00117A7BC1|nr:hypothetical protein [Fulvivirga sp. M361]TRX61861.1 hypothetical protein FNH22_03540 [Fulvivirga sp. M361]
MYCLRAAFFVILITSLSSYGQTQLSKQNDFIDGVYQTLDEFKTNNPSIPSVVIIQDKERYALRQVICEENIVYASKEGTSKIAAVHIWGICVYGDPYIRYKGCFIKIARFGLISTFALPLILYTGPDLPNTPDIDVFAVDLSTGSIFHQRNDASKIIDIIKRDEFFKNTRIKKKDIGFYINQYNARHPFSFSND